jgi:hypothetical protein
MPELFLAALGLVFLILLLQRLEHAETKLLISTIKWTFVGVMIFAAFYLTLVGRLLQVGGIAILLILLLRKDIQEWRQKRRTPLPLPHPMTKKEAASLLKVDLKASVQEINEAYESAVPKDTTEQDLLKQAKDVLLKSKKKKFKEPK